MGKKSKLLSIIVIMLVALSMATSFTLLPIMTQIASANPGDVDEVWHDTSTLTVDVTPLATTISWWDFQDSGGTSQLDAQVDVNNQYKFVMNMTQPSGWSAVDWINITAWYDNGSDATTYNESANLGGNKNMLLQYENTSGTAEWRMLWPDDEVTFNSGDCIEYDHNSTCHNITIPFTPLYQIRNAPGDGGWSGASNATDDEYSWNFNITVETIPAGFKSDWVNDEYGIYRYSEISSAGNPSMTGAPNTKATASAVDVVTRANANFSLSVELNASLDGPGAYEMANTTVGVAGGELAEVNFGGAGPLYLYGGAAVYTDHDNDTYERTTSTTFHCDIPYGQFPGQYTSDVAYHLRLET